MNADRRWMDYALRLGRRALGVVADVSDAAQVQAMVDQTVTTFGQIDILVNNAGARAGRPGPPRRLFSQQGTAGKQGDGKKAEQEAVRGAHGFRRAATWQASAVRTVAIR